MKNKKIIVINGLQRSGTNILYNIFQSHPTVCSINNKETGEVISQLYRFKSQRLISFLIRRFKRILYNLLNTKFILNSYLVYVFGIWIDRIFYGYKLKEFKDPYNRYKYKNVLYTKKEIKNCILCIKSIRKDIALTKFLSRVYNDIYFIGIVRNGYALCESWIRRKHKTPYEFGVMFRDYYQTMINYSNNFKNFIIIKFEDILKDPFSIAFKLYEFTKLKPTNLTSLRLNVKKRLTKNGSHSVKYGIENTKYWFESNNINDFIDANIDNIQINQLSNTDKKLFEIEAKKILKFFNYLE